MIRIECTWKTSTKTEWLQKDCWREVIWSALKMCILKTLIAMGEVPCSNLLLIMQVENNLRWKQHYRHTENTRAAAFIYDVAAVKKIDGVPPPCFNLVFQVSALFHHEWPRFHHERPRFNLVLNLPRFWSPPISFWSGFAGKTNISTNPAWRHILSSSSQINAVAHIEKSNFPLNNIGVWWMNIINTAETKSNKIRQGHKTSWRLCHGHGKLGSN